MNSASPAGLWSIDARRFLVVLGFLAGLGLLVAGWSSRTGPKRPTSTPPRLVLNPNTAPPEILTALPGLGPGLVKNWVEAREKRPFRSLEDLERRVRGVGPATLARIAQYLEIPTEVPAIPAAEPDGDGERQPGPLRRRTTSAQPR